MFPQDVRIEPGLPQRGEPFQKPFHTLIVKENPRPPFVSDQHRLQRSAPRICKDRLPRSHRFQRDDPEIFFARENECPATGVVPGQTIIWLPTGECDVWFRHSFQTRPVRSLSDDHQSVAGPVEGLDRKIDRFVRNKRADDKVVPIIPRREREETGVNRRIDHIRSAAIYFLDARSDILRNCDEVTGIFCGSKVPAAQRTHNHPHGHPRDHVCPPFAKVLVVLSPDVAHRRVAVAQMERV